MTSGPGGPTTATASAGPQNTADTGVVVNGDNVTATGLFVEHYQKFQVIWNGDNGTDVFFQSEMPYDVPSQAAWMSSPTTKGYAAVLVSPTAQHFTGYGMGTYSFFNQGIDIFAAHAYEAPNPANVRMHDLLTIFLDRRQRQGRHPQRHQRHRRPLDDRQPRRSGNGHQLPVTSCDQPAAAPLKRYSSLYRAGPMTA